MDDFPHYSPIIKLVYISRAQNGTSKIGALDQNGIISVWNIVEVYNELTSEYDLNMNIGCKYKMCLNFYDSLFDY